MLVDIEVDISTAQHQSLDHDIAMQQRPNSDFGGGLGDAQHLRRAMARQIGQADILDGERGGLAQGKIYVAAEHHFPAGFGFDGGGDFGLVGVEVGDHENRGHNSGHGAEKHPNRVVDGRPQTHTKR